MTWLGLIGPLTGMLGLTVAVVNALMQRRGQDHTEKLDVERLGHDDLVAALDAQRSRIADLISSLQGERTQRELEVAEWKARAEKAEAEVLRLRADDL